MIDTKRYRLYEKTLDNVEFLEKNFRVKLGTCLYIHLIFYVQNKEKLFLYVQKSFRSDLGNANHWNMIFPGFPVIPVQEIDHFSCFPTGNSNTRKCATLTGTYWHVLARTGTYWLVLHIEKCWKREGGGGGEGIGLWAKGLGRRKSQINKRSGFARSA